MSEESEIIPEAEPQATVEDQEFDHAVEFQVAPAEPHHGLYQPYFPLSEADFLRLESRARWPSVSGAALLAFGLTQGLPILNLAVRKQLPGDLSLARWLLPLVAVIIGGSLIALGLTLSKDRRRVRRTIREHFTKNPGEAVVRRSR